MSDFNASVVLQAYDGQLFSAPAGTVVPDDTVTPLEAAFVSEGWLHEDGLVLNPGLSADDPIKGWPRGEILLQPAAILEPTFKFSVMQHDSDALDWIIDPSRERVIVLEYKASLDGDVHRLVLPRVKIKEAGEYPFNITDPINIEVTVGCVRDDVAGYTFAFIIPGTTPGTNDVIKSY